MGTCASEAGKIQYGLGLELLNKHISALGGYRGMGRQCAQCTTPMIRKLEVAANPAGF